MKRKTETRERLPAGSVAIALAAITALAVFSRLIFLSPATNMVADSPSYLYTIRHFLDHWAQGHWLSTIEMGHPLYIAWTGSLVFVQRLIDPTGDLVLAIKVAGIITTASSILPLYWLACWLLERRRIALVAAWLYAALPIVWWWSGEVMSDASTTAVLVWAFGLLARWRVTGRARWLVAACLVFGAAPLARVSTVAFAPLFLWWWLGGPRKNLVPCGLWSLALLAVPGVSTVMLDWAYFGRDFGAVLERTAMHSHLDWTRLGSGDVWGTYGRLMLHGLGWAGVGTVALGLGLNLVRWRLVAMLVLWTAATLVLPIVIPVIGMQIRMLLPLAPMAALLMALAIDGVTRRLGRVAGGVAAAALGIGLVVQAFPDLQTMQTRMNYADALALWCRDNTPPNALVIAGGERDHIRHLAGRPAILYMCGWISQESARQVTTPLMLLKVDNALRTGRSVFATGMMNHLEMRMLRDFYRVETVARLPGAGLRNIEDVGFAAMGDRMRQTRDLPIYRLHRASDSDDRTQVRSAPAARSHRRVDGRIAIKVDCARFANFEAYPLIGSSPAALDWFVEWRQADALRDTFAKIAPYYKKKLDARGRATFLVDAPAGRIFASYLVVEGGALRFGAVAAEVKERAPGGR